jgi:hypothetical protein
MADDQLYDEVPDTSRSISTYNDTVSKALVRLIIQISDEFDIYIVVDTEDYSDLTIEQLKFRIRQ